MRASNRSGRLRNPLNFHANQLLMAAAVSALVAPSGRVMASSVWTGPLGTTSVPTTGNWNTATDWSATGVPAGGVTQELDFLGGASPSYISTDDVPGAFVLNKLVLNSAGSSIAAGSGNSLTLDGTAPTVSQAGTGTFTLSTPVSFTGDTAVQVASGGELDFNGVLTSSNAFNLSNSTGSGNAIVKLLQANTFASATNVNDPGISPR